MPKFSDEDVSFIRLLQRSTDTGDGWRNVSTLLWRLVERFPHKELLETDLKIDGSGKVRLSERGRIVVEYL